MPEPTRQRRAALLNAAMVVALLLWLVFDVYARSVVRPLEPERHRSDFTVYLAASDALYHGRNPYHVVNPRGWCYLYAPFFAVLLRPLIGLRPEHAAAVWFLLQCAMGFGLASELRRLLRRADPTAAEMPGPEPWWIGGAALLAFTLLALEGVQRGNVPVFVTWLLVLGYRLASEDRAGLAWCGGMVLAMPATTKISPILPALTAVGLAIRRRPATGGLAAGGLLVGLLLWLFVAPAMVAGWQQNLALLAEWRDRVLYSPSFDADPNSNPASYRNQSLTHAAAMLGERLGVGELRVPVRIVQVAVLALLLLAALRVPAGDRAGAVVVLGMAGLAMGCISPKAWVHHYVAGTAALYALPVAAWRRGRTTAAYVFATVPWALCAIHFATEGFGGVLGLGLAAYVIAGLVWLLRAYRAGSSATSACCGDSVVS